MGDDALLGLIKSLARSFAEEMHVSVLRVSTTFVTMAL